MRMSEPISSPHLIGPIQQLLSRLRTKASEQNDLHALHQMLRSNGERTFFLLSSTEPHLDAKAGFIVSRCSLYNHFWHSRCIVNIKKIFFSKSWIKTITKICAKAAEGYKRTEVSADNISWKLFTDEILSVIKRKGLHDGMHFADRSDIIHTFGRLQRSD